MTTTPNHVASTSRTMPKSPIVQRYCLPKFILRCIQFFRTMKSKQQLICHMRRQR
ncbi:hypothetical protein PILCRDRAFT_826513 [Piloderma croceum F 1598]|uniref:Uncharacterized protein n=1 Tax=Piloderma croceum (strain F 1598) TaxID=765440 RepID=A0A0C3F9D9_PILCF|nr:hypothetical protein PILCRDRAFT_826513 [Piloderma croceum F 1598]